MPKNLLVADDSITIQKVVGITFAGEDFRITAVDNGDDAIARARELKPDLILADVVMPRKNGYEVCEAIKADPDLRHIPVLLLAGTFEAFDEARARAVHADAHIAKPFESQALLNKVKELLERPAQAPAAGRVVAPSVKPASPPPAASGARQPPPRAPARPPPGPPAPARPPGVAPLVGRPLSQPAGAATVALRPAGSPPGARAPAGPPSAPPPGARPSGAPPRAAPPIAPAFARPPAGPPPAPRSAMPAPPPRAPAVLARDPFGLGEARAAPPGPLAGSPDHLDLDWGELDGAGAAAQPVPAALPPSAAAVPVANAPVVGLEELDFEPGLDTDASEPGSVMEAIELPDVPDEELELAPASDFIPSSSATGHAPEPPTSAMELELEPLAPTEAEVPPVSGRAATDEGGEAQLRQALSQASREVIERIAWEVVPQLAETIIREQLERLMKERQR